MGARGRNRIVVAGLAVAVGVRLMTVAAADEPETRPKVIVISLDGAQPALVEQYLKRGVLDRRTGLGRLRTHGSRAEQNFTVTPSVTAVSHLAIATGSTSVHNDVSANSIHPVAGAIGANLSGFGAPIGGYQITPLGPTEMPTAEPLWVKLRENGRQVVTATWPGGDGANILIGSTLVQGASPTRTTDYTVPFGAFGGVGAMGFIRHAADFELANGTLVTQLSAAGRQSFSPVMVTTSPIESVFCASAVLAFNPCALAPDATRTLRYDMKVAALDTTNDQQTNYDLLAFFDTANGIQPGPFTLPATGPAYARAGRSASFYYKDSGNKVGSAFFVTAISSNLSEARFVRYGANFIPRNAAVIGVVDDVNEHVGFWAPQPDFRIPERLSPGFGDFSDEELEAVYRDQVKTFVDYQTRLALHAIDMNPAADLVMIYIEQPDGSGHQFTLTDPRQATDPLDPTTVGRPGNPFGATGQDRMKTRRYADHLEFAYQAASHAVERIIRALGVDRDGAPRSDVFVVSDHGMALFHTAVRLNAILTAGGIDTGLLNIRTTGPAANIYVNLAGREAGGTVSESDYLTLVERIATVLRSARDPNTFFNPTSADLFTHVWTRPGACGTVGFCTDDQIGQDTGDVLALMAVGYNFDGTQAPVVTRLGDSDAVVTGVYSVPNFYGAHGHDSNLTSMSAILYAAGPHVRKGRTLSVVRNIDIAPTILEILGVAPALTVDGRVLFNMLKPR